MAAAVDIAERDRRHRAVTVGAALAALGATVALTRRGVLLDPDSTTYLRSARWFRSDPGLILRPPTGTSLSVRGLFPPLYPVVLAVAGLGGHDLGAARVLGCLLAAAAVALAAHLVARHASPPTAVVAVSVLALSRGFLLVDFAFLMSDGLYLVLALAVVVACGRVVETDDARTRRRGVLAAGALAAAAFATRFVGLGVVAGVAVAIGLLGRAPGGARRRGAALAALIGLAPTVAWVAIEAHSGGAGSRRLGYRPLHGAHLDFLRGVTHPFLPRQAIDALGPTGSLLAGSLAFAGVVAWSLVALRAARRPAAGPTERTVGVLLLVGWGHLATLVGTRVVVDLQIPLGGRHTMLWTACLVLAGAIDLHRWATARPAGTVDRARRARTAAAAAVLLAAGAAPGFVRGLADPVQAWSNLAQQPRSALADRAAALPAGVVVFTNREDVVYLQTGRATRRLPLSIDPYSGDPDPHYPREVAAMAQRVRDGRAVVLWFRDEAEWAPPLDELTGPLGLVVVERDREGVVLGAEADA